MCIRDSYAPREYLSRAYHDAPKYCATIETVQVKKDEVVFPGEIPARCIQAVSYTHLSGRKAYLGAARHAELYA